MVLVPDRNMVGAIDKMVVYMGAFLRMTRLPPVLINIIMECFGRDHTVYMFCDFAWKCKQRKICKCNLYVCLFCCCIACLLYVVYI